tara:strand:- start:2580 stop:2807 length:228 start_codon:yes stop_codon:yes gene_type:complete
MWLAKGDLVRIPAQSCLTKRMSELSLIDQYTYLKEPTMGIFMGYTNEQKGIVFIKNNYWMIDLKDIKYVEVKSAG